MNKYNIILLLIGFFLSTLVLGQGISPAEDEVPTEKEEYSPFVDDYYPDQVYFGDIHLHSDWSTDAGMVGATLGPDEAYRASMGEEVTAYSGYRFKLIRPLDFVVLSDHAENLGLADFIRRSDPLILSNPVGKRWHDLNKAGKGYDAFLEWLRGLPEDQIKEPKLAEAIWPRVIENADKYNKPGVFTTFTAYEWTSQPGGNNLHRIVIFRDDKSRTSQVLPFSQFDSPDPEDLWAYMAAYEEKTGGRVISPAHNGNLSNGIMFDNKTLDGKPLTAAYAEMRMRFEPIYEVTQIKGDGESHPLLSPDDEFADYENMDKGNLPGLAPKTPEMLPGEYGRSALKRGLELEAQIGVNPYKFGMGGATDGHTGLPSTREDNFFGKAHIVEPGKKRAGYDIVAAPDPALSIKNAESTASGLTAVWARENTRDGIFDAMVRKEVYATTGSRIRVRVFGGWDFDPSEVTRPDFAREGYARGVPMGGDLSDAPAGKAPGFMIRALRDPDGANIDRVQVIKGWIDASGEVQERIYDVAVSDDRKIGKDGRCKTPVGNTVDVADASFTNTIGTPLLSTYWEDPDFDASQSAFYYVRVIEIPTPRWTAYDVKRLGSKFPEGTKMVLQDRAYTSPIWYTPSK